MFATIITTDNGRRSAKEKERKKEGESGTVANRISTHSRVACGCNRPLRRFANTLRAGGIVTRKRANSAVCYFAGSSTAGRSPRGCHWPRKISPERKEDPSVPTAASSRPRGAARRRDVSRGSRTPGLARSLSVRLPLSFSPLPDSTSRQINPPPTTTRRGQCARDGASSSVLFARPTGAPPGFSRRCWKRSEKRAKSHTRNSRGRCR